jgi:hypothetical protein
MTSKAIKSADSNRSSATRSTAVGKPAKRKIPRHIEAAIPEPASTSKQQQCLDLLARRDGASVIELVAVTDWQPHSVRGFLSGTVKKKLGLTLHAAQGDDGSRRYWINRPSRSR